MFDKYNIDKFFNDTSFDDYEDPKQYLKDLKKYIEHVCRDNSVDDIIHLLNQELHEIVKNYKLHDFKVEHIPNAEHNSLHIYLQPIRVPEFICLNVTITQP